MNEIVYSNQRMKGQVITLKVQICVFDWHQLE
jgi:hypothetical protein